MKNRYLKGNKNFWAVLPNQSDADTWKEMLRIRNDILPYLNYALGMGFDISFWFDSWCGKGRLIDLLGLDALVEIGGPGHLVDHFIRQEHWSLPSMSNYLVN